MKLKIKKKKSQKFLLNSFFRIFNSFTNKYLFHIFKVKLCLICVSLFSYFLVFSSCYRADKIAQEGLLKLEQKKYVTALTLFEDVLENVPEHAIALYGKGSILIQQEVTRHMGKLMLKKAISSLSLKELKKKSYLLLVEFSNVQESIQIFQDMLQKKLSDSYVYSKLASYQLKLNKKREALVTYLEGIQKYPEKNHLKGELAFFYASHMRNYRKALEYYQEAVSREKNEESKNIEYLMGLAKTNYIVGKKKDSIAIIQKILDKKKISKDKIKELRKIKKDITKYRWMVKF